MTRHPLHFTPSREFIQTGSKEIRFSLPRASFDVFLLRDRYVIDRMLPDFLLQVRYNHQLGLNQAMVSFNSNGRTIIGGQLSGGSEMIATLLRASLPANVANSIAVVAFSPSGSTFVGKEQHLTIAKKHFGVRLVL